MIEKEPPEKTKTLGSTGEAVQSIGPYHLLQKLGEGGMGEVWIAEQHKPIHRRVALKIIKPGMDTKHVIARFESERQALAMMDHPTIAKVFEAGETPRGRPYFVMEYVPGIPITTYCDQNRLTTTERLELFIHVCEGVQHAHQKAIIHRDLKPSNILVANQDGKPIPKVIDFGVAKATARSLTEKTMFTELGVLIGTPEYMSPEQAEMSGLNVDTRTDTYSLGTILYELLIGALPFDPIELRRAGIDEIRRKIREEDPPKPSTKLSTMGEASSVQAEHRRTERPALIRQIRGDLDWITMKALEKDRTRRYGTPSELAADIDRFLRHQPIIARSPSTSYRARKFVRRHRFGVAIVGSLIMMLVAFAAAVSIQASRIARERDRTQIERDRAEGISAFLVSLFEASDPDRSKGDKLTARELLDKGVERLEVELKNEPETRAALLHTIGKVYFQLGLQDAAEHALQQALLFRRTLSGAARLELAATLNELGKVYFRNGDYDRAEAANREALDIRRSMLGATHKEVAISLHNLANVESMRGRLAEAEGLYKEAIPMLRASDDPSGPALSILALGGVYWRQGKLGLALDTDREALDLLRRTLGVEHSWTLSAMNSVGHVLFECGEYAEAERLQREVLAIRRKLVGNSHFDVALALYNLGNTLEEEGRFAEAEQALRESLAIWRRTLPDPHVQTAFAINDLAIVLTDQGRCADAESLYGEALAMFQKMKSAPSNAAWSMGGLGDVARCCGRLDEAEKYYRAALELRKKSLGSLHPLVADTEVALGRLLTERGAYEEAERLLGHSLELRRQSLPEKHWRIGYSQMLLGNCVGREGRFGDAEPLLVQGYELLREKRGEGRKETREAAGALVALYEAWGKLDQAAMYRKQAGRSIAK